MTELAFGVAAMESVQYNGKSYNIPIFDEIDPVVLEPAPVLVDIDAEHPILQALNKPFSLEEFKTPRIPISLGCLSLEELSDFTRPDTQRTLDMPIKFPGDNEYRLPRALGQFACTLQRIINFEHTINPEIDDYYAYLTIDQGLVQPGTLHREAPCHVDGFQGARWQPKLRGNHTYTVADILPTAYYVQPFVFDDLDEAVHDFFWEMNAQVADTKEKFRWQSKPAEITLMDCYNVHRGVSSPTRDYRTWLRLSFEERGRVFDRLGNAHNPLFDYDWTMVERDIEQLGLVPYRTDVDQSLNVFPWQALDGSPLPTGSPKTQPKLR